MNIIKSINLSKDTPVVSYTKIDGEQTTDSVFPGKGSEPILPAISFEDAVLDLIKAFLLVPEFSPEGRFWSIKSVAYLWDDEFAEWGFKVSLTGVQQGSMIMDVVVKETSPDQIDDRIYAALEKLRHEAERYVRGVSAQFNLIDQEAACGALD